VIAKDIINAPLQLLKIATIIGVWLKCSALIVAILRRGWKDVFY
jgi:hypothetical protein